MGSNGQAGSVHGEGERERGARSALDDLRLWLELLLRCTDMSVTVALRCV